VVAGELRITYAEFDVAVNRAAHALADRGLAKGDRVAALLRHPREGAGPAGSVAEAVLAPTAEKALATAGVAGGVRGWIPLSGAAPDTGWEDVDDWGQGGRGQAPAVLAAARG